MKKISLIFLFISLFAFGIQAQRISASGCGVTVYTDNGAYVKAFSKNTHNVNVKMTFTEEVVKNGETTNYESNYSFSIAANEEKQLFFSSNKVIALSITSCEEELSAEEQDKVAKKEETLKRLRQRRDVQ